MLNLRIIEFIIRAIWKSGQDLIIYWVPFLQLVEDLGLVLIGEVAVIFHVDLRAFI